MVKSRGYKSKESHSGLLKKVPPPPAHSLHLRLSSLGSLSSSVANFAVTMRNLSQISLGGQINTTFYILLYTVQ